MIISIIFLILFLLAIIIGTLFGGMGFMALSGGFGCEESNTHMAIGPLLFCILLYAIAYGFLCLSRMEWMF